METSTQIVPQQPNVRRPLAPKAPWLRLLPDDGWFTVILLALCVFITVFSIESVTPPWAPGMHILTATTAFGLLLGYLSVQQGRLPGALVHSVAVILGIVLAFLQTADAVLDGDRLLLLQHTSNWFQRAVVSGGQSSDNTVFLLFLAILTFLLAYITVWLVLRTRRPWLAVLANGVVLLINLNWATPDKLIFLLLFLLVSLLLLVRFTLAENIRHWKARGLRFSSDLSWDFMQAGAIFAVVVLLLAYLLPVGQANAQLQEWAASPQNPLNTLQAKFTQIFAGVVGSGPGAGGINFFDSSLRLRGTNNLPNTQILHYTLPNPGDDGSQYLITQTYDSYDGIANWTSTVGQQVGAQKNKTLPSSSPVTKVDTYQITFDNVPLGGEIQLFAPGSEAARFSVNSTYTTRGSTDVPTLWQADKPLQAGDQYVAAGYVSTATVQQLSQVPYPSQSTDPELYPAGVMQLYLPENTRIDPFVKQKALEATKGTTTMYDAAVHLENYLRAGFKYDTNNPDPPANEDAVAWFLQQKKGFCTFFASAMAMMGRSLGMPTRVALGFTYGTYDQNHGYYVVRGTQAHMWTQIYFGSKYGWINFEPTESFGSFFRPQDALPGTTPGATGTGVAATPPRTGHNDPGLPIGGNGGPNSPQNSAVVRIGLGLSALILFVLLLAVVFLVWWRMSFRGLAPAAGALARVTRLGRWAGAPPLPAQTPHEYAERLASVVPAQQATIEHLANLYSRERWSGEIDLDDLDEAPRLYERIRASITPVIMRRLRSAPGTFLHGVGRVRQLLR